MKSRGAAAFSGRGREARRAAGLRRWAARRGRVRESGWSGSPRPERRGLGCYRSRCSRRTAGERALCFTLVEYVPWPAHRGAPAPHEARAIGVAARPPSRKELTPSAAREVGYHPRRYDRAGWCRRWHPRDAASATLPWLRAARGFHDAITRTHGLPSLPGADDPRLSR